MTILIAYNVGEMNIHLDKLFTTKRKTQYSCEYVCDKPQGTKRILKGVIPLCSKDNIKDIEVWLKRECVEWLEPFQLEVIKAGGLR